MSEPARQDVTKVEETPVSAPTTIIHLIERAASDPNIDVDKMERLYAMHERALAREAKLAFTAAKLAMKPKLPTIDEKGSILDRAGKVQSTYAEWEDIADAIEPILIEHGFDLSFRPGSREDGRVVVVGVLTHEQGHVEEAEVLLPIDASGGKNSVQGVGSSISYGKRYSAIALLNIKSRAPRDRDDDGQRAGLGQEAQDAIANINMADTMDDLRKWRADHFDRLSKTLKQHELAEVVALWNRRRKAFVEQAKAAAFGGGQ